MSYPTLEEAESNHTAAPLGTCHTDLWTNENFDPTYLFARKYKALASRKEPVKACNSWELLAQKTPQVLETDTFRYLATQTVAQGKGSHYVELEQLDLVCAYKDVKLVL